MKKQNYYFVTLQSIPFTLFNLKTMEIKDNQLLRQFETQTPNGLLVMEYAIQEKKLFLTKLIVREEADASLSEDFMKAILALATEKKFKVVPTHPLVAQFFRKNPVYKEMLPPGIKI